MSSPKPLFYYHAFKRMMPPTGMKVHNLQHTENSHKRLRHRRQCQAAAWRQSKDFYWPFRHSTPLKPFQSEGVWVPRSMQRNRIWRNTSLAFMSLHSLWGIQELCFNLLGENIYTFTLQGHFLTVAQLCMCTIHFSTSRHYHASLNNPSL